MSKPIWNLIDLWRCRARLFVAAGLVAGLALTLVFDRPPVETIAGALFVCAGLALLPKQGALYLGLTLLAFAPLLIWQGLIVPYGAPFWFNLTAAFVVGATLATLLSKMRSPLTHRFSGAAFLEADRSVVWRTILIRPSCDYWDANVARIDPVMGAPNKFRKIYSGVLDGLDMTVEVLDVVPGERFSVRGAPDGGAALDDAEIETQTYWIEEVEGGVWLHSASVLERPLLWTLLVAALCDPPQDQLRRIKLYIEEEAEADILSGGAATSR